MITFGMQNEQRETNYVGIALSKIDLLYMMKGHHLAITPEDCRAAINGMIILVAENEHDIAKVLKVKIEKKGGESDNN